MCGRFLFTSPVESVREVFGLDTVPSNLPPRYNIAPTQPIAVIRLTEPDSPSGATPGRREFAVLRWGLVPSWMKALPTDRPMINARAETVAEKPSFRAAFRRRRCLVPADGWYEWAASRSGAKQPYLVRLKNAEARPFAFAGLWERWHGPAGEDWLETATILTKPAETGLEAIHPRMPVVLDRRDYDRWLAPAAPPPASALAGLRLLPSAAFEAYPVSTRVNRIANDEPGLATPVFDTQPTLL